MRTQIFNPSSIETRMFLSKFLAALSGVIALVLILAFRDYRGLIGFAISSICVVLFFAIYRFSVSDWIWIGPTIGQMEAELAGVKLAIVESDRQTFPVKGESVPRPLPNSREIAALRPQLFARKRKLEEMIEMQKPRP